MAITIIDNNVINNIYAVRLVEKVGAKLNDLQ